jgi:hypothetical protein
VARVRPNHPTPPRERRNQPQRHSSCRSVRCGEHLTCVCPAGDLLRATQLAVSADATPLPTHRHGEHGELTHNVPPFTAAIALCIVKPRLFCERRHVACLRSRPILFEARASCSTSAWIIRLNIPPAPSRRSPGADHRPPSPARNSSFPRSIWSRTADQARTRRKHKRKRRSSHAGTRQARHWVRAATRSSRSVCTLIRGGTMRPKLSTSD